jgi:hypothetical protein
VSKFDDIVNKTYKLVSEQDQDVEAYVSGMNFQSFLENLVSVLGSKNDLHTKLRIISKMAFDAKRDQDKRSKDTEN